MDIDTDRFNHLLRKATEAARYGEEGWSGQSTGERVAVAFILNRFDWLQKMGYSIPEALFSMDHDWRNMLLYVHKILKKNGDIK